MVSDQFDTTKSNDNDENLSPGDDRVEDIVDGEPSNEQLQQAADELNSANNAPEEDAPVEQRVPRSVQNRMDIMEGQAERRRGDMIQGSGVGPETNTNQGAGPDFNMNAENVYYGEFGSEQQNFAGESFQQPENTNNQEIPVNQEPGAEDVPKMVSVKVDGVEAQVSQEDLIRSFQKNSTADKRLNDATDLLKQAQGAAAANLQPTGTTPVNQTESSTIPTEPINEPGLDDIDYADIAEKIQLGEASEGAEALKDLVEKVSARNQDNSQSLDPAAFGEQVANMVQDRTTSENARKAFEKNYTDITSNPELHSMAGRNAVEIMIEDFVANGADEKTVADARANPTRAAEVHRQLRHSGDFKNLRTPDQLYTEAGNRTREWVAKVTGQPANVNPATKNVQNPAAIPRSERAKTAQQSPQSRQAPPRQAQQAQRVQSPSDIVAEMKRGRGQKTVGQRRAAR